MMMLVGSLNFFYGLGAVLNDDVVIVGGHGTIIADLTTWGWVTLVLGLIVGFTGFGLLTGSGAARWAAVFFVDLERDLAGLDLPGRPPVGVHHHPR